MLSGSRGLSWWRCAELGCGARDRIGTERLTELKSHWRGEAISSPNRKGFAGDPQYRTRSTKEAYTMGTTV